MTEQESIIQERLNLSNEALVNARRKREANLIDEVDMISAGFPAAFSGEIVSRYKDR